MRTPFIGLLLAMAAMAAPTPSKDDLPPGAIARLGEMLPSSPKETPQPSDINALAYLADDLLMVGTNRGWQSWDLVKRQPRQSKPVGGPAFIVRHDPQRILIGGVKKLHLVEPPESATLEPRSGFESRAERVTVLATAPASGRVVFSEGERSLNFLTLGTSKVVRVLALESVPVAAAFTANGRLLTVATHDGSVRCYSLAADGTLTQRWAKRMLRNNHIVLSYNADGRLLAVGSAGRVVVLDSVTGQVFRNFDRLFGEGDIRSVAFAPSSLQIATGNRTPEQVVRVWNILDGQEVATFKGHQGSVTALAFAPNGKTLASGGTDGSVLLWKVPPSTHEKNVAPEEAWNTLDSLDPKIGFRMMTALLERGPEAIPLLRDGIFNASQEEDRLRKLVAQLDHDEFRIREVARKGLTQAGLRAMPLLRDPKRPRLGAEGEQRVQHLLEYFEMVGLRTPENGVYGEALRHLRAVRILEILNTPAARQAVEKIAQGKAETPGTQEAKAALMTWPQR